MARATFATSKDIAQPAMFFTPLYEEPVDKSSQIAELIAQRTTQEEIIKTLYARCKELKQQIDDFRDNYIDARETCDANKLHKGA